MAKYVKLYGNDKTHCSWEGMTEDKDCYDSIIAVQHENSMEEHGDCFGEVSDMKLVLRFGMQMQMLCFQKWKVLEERP